MSRRSMLSAALAALAFSGALHAQDKPVEWKFAHWLPPTHPLQKLGF